MGGIDSFFISGILFISGISVDWGPWEVVALFE